MVEASSDREVKVTPARSHVTHAWMTSGAFTELTSEAQRRRMHPDALTAAIVDRVIAGGLVDAILDDPRFQ